MRVTRPASLSEFIVLQPTTYEAMGKGIDQIVNAIRPTLGPLSRRVAIDQMYTKNAPEILESGGVIARRIIELGNRDHDMGAMLVRGMICRLHDEVGDGTATAAVLFHSIYTQGVHYLTSGGSSMRLRGFLEEGLALILDQLDAMRVPLEGESNLGRVAAAICHDQPLADMLGEIFDYLGEYGEVDIRDGYRRQLESEYVEGSYWPGGLFSREMITDHTQLKTEFEESAVLLTDFELDNPRDIVPVIEMVMDAGAKSLVVVARSVTDFALAGFNMANKHPKKFRLMVVKTPGLNADDRAAALEDLAYLTGATPLVAIAGYTLNSVKLEHLGWTQRAWATPVNFGIVGGRGDIDQLRGHIESLITYSGQIDEVEARRKPYQRIGRLLGGSATIWIGGGTETEIKARKDIAVRTVDVLRIALSEGALPGAGMALLSCRRALQDRMQASTDPDERAAYRILAKVMAVPTHTILANAGYDADEVMAELKFTDPGCGFNVLTGQIVDVVQAGIVDAAAVQMRALHSAISTAALALTIDVLVHHRYPDQVGKPD